MARIMLLGCLILCLRSYSYAACESPHYHSIDNLESKVGPLRIVLDPRDFTIGKIVCLSETLKGHYPEWQNVSLLIFMSEDAAKHFVKGVAELTSDDKKAEAQLRVVYTLNRDKHEEYLKILPFGMWHTSSSVLTYISFPVEGTPHCRVEMKGRCLFALDDLEYPAPSAAVSGMITIRGTITPTGKISDVQIGTSSPLQDAEANRFIDAARRNLLSWQLESRKVQDTIQITYRYEIDQSLERNATEVNFELPDQIVIRGNP